MKLQPHLRHSLRTPLTHIIGYAEMVRDETQDRDAAAAMEEVRALARRISDALQAAEAQPAGQAFEEIGPLLDKMLQRVKEFENRSDFARPADLQKIRAAAAELMAVMLGDEDSGSGQDPAEPQPPTDARILVVDDDEDNRDILRRRLEREGFETATEASGEAALARLERESFDLVLLDLLMPGMDGFAVLARIKERPDLRGVPVVVLSALDDLASAVRSIEMGAEDFLPKPFDPVLLRARLGAILKRRSVEAQHAELAESRELLLESSGEGIFGIDRRGVCTFINRAALELLGYSRRLLMGRLIHPMIHHSRPDGSPYPAQECPLYQVLATGEPQRGTETIFRADGTPLAIDYSAYPMRRQGRVEGVVLTFADAGERKRAEEQMLQSAKLESLGVLAGGVAHDFNNILTGILGNASLVIENLPSSDPNRAQLAEILAASERAADLTRQMLAFAGKGQFVIEAVDLSRAIEEIAELLETSVPKLVELELRLAADLPPVKGDRRQLQQLIFNLVVNAGEAIGERQGMVTVETGVRGPDVYAAVSDTGMGMDAATQARMFDPFFSTKFTGRGLGLAAATGIVRSHRGSIQVESEPGRGSRFEVLLPAMGARARPGEKTILVVDDEEIVRRTTRNVLEKSGYRVLMAENGAQAVEIARQCAPEISLVLLDLTMPVMDGAEAARFLRSIRQDIPILVSSGYEEAEVSRRFEGNQISGFVHKPYTAAALLEKVRAAIGERAGSAR